MILQLLRRKRSSRTVDAIYGAVMAASRDPAYYTEFAVADTVEGRFDVLMLHVALLTRRLQRQENGDRALAQELTEAFFADMDRTIREMGIGDLSVPKRMKKISNAFFGRYTVYDEALTAEDRQAVAATLLRNIYDGNEGKTADADRLADRVFALAANLGAMPVDAIRQDGFALPMPARN